MVKKPPETKSPNTFLYDRCADLLYWFCKVTFQTIFRSMFRIRVEGREHCPKSGPLLVICNHLGEFDPPFMGCFLPWPVSWLAKIELARPAWGLAGVLLVLFQFHFAWVF